MYNKRCMHPSSTDFTDTLPILSYRDEILASVDAHQVTIITAETGAGKSTQVPQYLAEHGYDKIIITQPRILAARNLSKRVREEWAERNHEDSTPIIGYRTAHERDDDPDNVILYCTDGLQLVRELTGSGTNHRQVLVLDEIHEWNENMEVLIAWSKKRCDEDPHFKVVLMSATIEAESLASYFGEAVTISVPGRSYPVKKRHGSDLATEIFQHIDAPEARNVLVFLPGKAEIEGISDIVKKRAAEANIPIIPLHSQLEPEVQQRAFARYENGKIILATNVAQTSITIDDIDIVIDSGLERRAEVRSGVEGLFIAEVSQADCLQRAGRAGRTKPGEYILAQLDQLPCSKLDKRPEYGVPEILRKHIDRLVLRLANIGIDIEDLDFFHSPKRSAIKRAKSKLITLGAITKQGKVTSTGKAMERFPVSSGYARMLVEAEQYSAEIRSKLAAIIAIQEIEGIVKNGSRYTGWRRFTNQTRSDLLGQYDVYLALPLIDPVDYEDLGIIAKNVDKAEEVRERLLRDLGLENTEPSAIQDNEVEPLLRCIVAGQLDQLWSVQPNGDALHLGSDTRRELSSGTLVKNASLIAGTPFDLEVPTPKGLQILNLVTDVSAVDPSWLEELAPHLFEVKEGKVYYDPAFGTLALRTHLQFNGHSLEAAGTPILEHTPENERLFIKQYALWAHNRLEIERDRLQKINSRHVPKIPLDHVKDRVAYLVDGIISIHELDKRQRYELGKLTRLDTYLGSKVMKQLNTNPHSEGRHQPRRRSGWRPGHKRRYTR
jgi:HrpA-like RNA helicase